MKPQELKKWLRENSLPDQWWISFDGMISAEPCTLDQAVQGRRGKELVVCHVSRAEESDWWPVETGPPPVQQSTDDSPFRASAAWRRHPASDRQKEVLRFFREPFPEEISKGQASEIIDRIFADPKNRERWDHESERRGDRELDRLLGELDRAFEKPRKHAPGRKAKKTKTSGCGCLLMLILLGLLIAALFLE